jgi:hypothetical protein
MAGFGIAAAGFIGELAIPNPQLPGVTYFFLFLVAVSLYCPFVCIVCLIGNNLAPSSKRAVGMALLISGGNFGGICGSNIYIQSQAPKYPLGFDVLRRAYRAENRKRDEFARGKTDAEIKAQYTDQELLDLGDRSPFYRYTV